MAEPATDAAKVMLGQHHADTAALRRYMVEAGFLDREDGQYWRSGGTVDSAVQSDRSTGPVITSRLPIEGD